MSTTVSLIVIRTRNLAAARAFYEVLGFDFVEEQHGAGAPHLSCERDGLVFEVYPAKTDALKSVNEVLLGFAVESLDDTLLALRSLGIEPNFAPKTAVWGRFVAIPDNDGRILHITEKPR